MGKKQSWAINIDRVNKTVSGRRKNKNTEEKEHQTKRTEKITFCFKDHYSLVKNNWSIDRANKFLDTLLLAEKCYIQPHTLIFFH